MLKHKELSRVIVIFLLLLSTLSGIQETNATRTSFDSPSFLPMDLNQDKISDYYTTQDQSVSSIVVFESDVYIPKMGVYFGQTIDRVLPHIPAIVLDLSANQINQISKALGVKLVEPNSKLIPLLSQSTAQLGVRNDIWNLGYNGSTDMSIAIVDSGIDQTHPGIGNRIIASYNAITQNKTSPGDSVGHGTHVAGIAAGYPTTSSTSFDQTTRGILPDPQNYAIALPLLNIEKTTTIDFVLDWGEKGVDSTETSAGVAAIDIETTQACNTCIDSDNDGLLQGSISVPAGDYLIGVFGASVNDLHQNQGEFYELSLETPLASVEAKNNPEIPEFAGVAFGSNIVNVKVTDQDPQGNMVGDVSTFVEAINWIIDNRKQYNITIVNLSIGVDTLSLTIDKKVEEMVDKGLLPVVAAGNEGSQSKGIYSPASSPFAISVGALGRSNEIAYYSSQGTSTTNSANIKPDVLAPGGSSASTILGFNTITDGGFEGLVSLDANGVGFDLTNDDLTPQEGTSMAAPHISGLAMLMAQVLTEQQNWDWDSSTSVLAIKRAILSSTFEVGNIGYGREEYPSGGYTGAAPSIDRDAKDYQEGWGAVDARAAFSLLQNHINLNTSYSMNFNLLDVYKQHVYAWSMHLEPNQGYGFALNVPNGVDADILIIDADNGPLYQGKDYGDLNILQSSTQSIGQDENLGIISDKAQDVNVIVRVVKGSSVTNASLTVSTLDNIPQIKITSPTDGTTINSSSVVVEFDSTSPSVQAYLDNNDIGVISSGYEITNLAEGGHKLDLEESVGIFKIRDTVTFTVDLPDSSTEDSSNQLLLFPILPILIISIIIASRLYPRRDR